MSKLNPLAKNALFTQEEVETIKQANADPTLDDYTRMTFIVKKELLEKLRDYAYTERIDLKEAINRSLDSFLKDKKDLLKAPERPRQTRTKKG